MIGSHCFVEEHTVQHADHVGGNIAGTEIQLAAADRFFLQRIRPPGHFKINIVQCHQVHQHPVVCQDCGRHGISCHDVIGTVAGHGVVDDRVGPFSVVGIVAGGQSKGQMHIQPLLHRLVPLENGIIYHIPVHFFRKEFNKSNLFPAEGMDFFSGKIQVGRQIVGLEQRFAFRFHNLCFCFRSRFFHCAAAGCYGGQQHDKCHRE